MVGRKPGGAQKPQRGEGKGALGVTTKVPFACLPGRHLFPVALAEFYLCLGIPTARARKVPAPTLELDQSILGNVVLRELGGPAETCQGI